MILFVNGCPRKNSRTLDLAKAVLQCEEGTAQEVNLFGCGPEPLNAQRLALRDELLFRGEMDHPMLRWAHQFARADVIIIAAPYWDLMFPAMVRAYLEAVTVCNVTFRYNEQGVPQGLCRAKKLIYVTTAGGPIVHNFGFDYVKGLCESFYGIRDVSCVSAEGLDIRGADAEAIVLRAKQEYFKRG